MKTVKDFIEEQRLRARIVTFAIHQTKDECIAAFTKSRETGWISFAGWNDDVKNRTSHHTREALLKASVRRTWNVTNDWVCIEIEE